MDKQLYTYRPSSNPGKTYLVEDLGRVGKVGNLRLVVGYGIEWPILAYATENELEAAA